ncbi:MAG: hypothetical protein OXC91_02350 [Rhodobacteraceae bacterium]|nr:hypothetical protein [Paracoccaceae bacterium]
MDIRSCGWSAHAPGWTLTTDDSATATLFGSNVESPGDDDWIPSATNDTVKPGEQIQDVEAGPVAWLRFASEGGVSTLNFAYLGDVKSYLSNVGPVLSLTESALSIPNDIPYDLSVHDFLDSDQANLVFAISTSDSGVFTVLTIGDTTTITPRNPGTANLLILGTNIAGGSTSVQIEVTVEA